MLRFMSNAADRFVQASKTASRHLPWPSLHARWRTLSPCSCSWWRSDAPSERRRETQYGQFTMTARCRAVWRRTFIASSLPAPAAAAERRSISSMLVCIFTALCSALYHTRSQNLHTSWNVEGTRKPRSQKRHTYNGCYLRTCTAPGMFLTMKTSTWE